MYLPNILTTAITISGAISAALPTRSLHIANPRIRQIVEFEPKSWFENIAVRSDGTLLVTRLDVPELWTLDPNKGNASYRIATFPGVTSALGIAEYAPDVFAIVVGNLSLTKGPTPGTYSLQTIDLSRGLDPAAPVIPTLLANINNATNLNGLTFREPCTLYSADSFGHQIWSVDTETRVVSLAAPFNPLFNASAAGFGINGLRWDSRGQQLLFTSTEQGIIGRVPATENGFGPAEKLAAGSLGGLDSFDDFALGPLEGNVFAATQFDNSVAFVSRDGTEVLPIAGAVNSTLLAGATSGAFGRSKTDSMTMYVTTGGGQGKPVNGNETTGAKILALDFDY